MGITVSIPEDPFVLAMFVTTLCNEGYHIEWAGNGLKRAKAVRGEDPQVTVTNEAGRVFLSGWKTLGVCEKPKIPPNFL
jgi:hypothetical protein